MNILESTYERAGELAHRCQPALRRAWQKALLRRGRDITAESAGRSCLVIAPHPDDETLGCGATIARKVAAGTPVTVVIAADGRHSHGRSTMISPDQLRTIRAAEAVEATSALGLRPDQVTQLGHEDNHLADALPALTAQLRALIDEAAPDEILFASALDYHRDHRALNRAVRDVLAVAKPPGCHLAEFPVWHWLQGPWVDLSDKPRAARAVHLVTDPLTSALGPPPDLVSTAGFLECKRAALSAYRSQTTNLTGEPEWAIMGPELLDPFMLAYEPFFPVRSLSASTPS